MSDLYDDDPHAWAMEQADRLRLIAREHPGLGLDWPHLIEELDGMAGSDRRRVESLAGAVMEHLLLLEHSPAKGPRRGWKSEVVDYRRGLDLILTPTLRRHLAERLDAVFGKAREAVRRKMEIFEEDPGGLPEVRPYTLEQVLDPGWWPEEAP